MQSKSIAFSHCISYSHAVLDFWEYFGVDDIRRYMHKTAKSAGKCRVWWTWCSFTPVRFNQICQHFSLPFIIWAAIACTLKELNGWLIVNHYLAFVEKPKQSQTAWRLFQAESQSPLRSLCTMNPSGNTLKTTALNLLLEQINKLNKMS